MDEVAFDNRLADGEGWAIFECYGSSYGSHHLCRSDEDDILPDDEAAWRLVVEKANAGSAYHIEALNFIRRYNAVEWVLFEPLHGRPLVYPGGAAMVIDGWLRSETGEFLDAGEGGRYRHTPHEKVQVELVD